MSGEVEPQRLRCQAKRADGSGRHCGAWAVRGRRVCYVHGGATPAPGPGHPNFKHGRYSKVVPRGIASLYHAGLTDPRLLEMNDELAILDARHAQLLNRVGSGESEGRWKLVQDSMRDVLSFQAQGDDENMAEAIGELSKAIFAGSDYESWREIMAVVDARRKVANTERARLQAAQQTITTAQLMAMMGALSGIINSRVTDPVLKSEIADDIRRLMLREGQTAELPAVAVQ